MPAMPDGPTRRSLTFRRLLVFARASRCDSGSLRVGEVRQNSAKSLGRRLVREGGGAREYIHMTCYMLGSSWHMYLGILGVEHSSSSSSPWDCRRMLSVEVAHVLAVANLPRAAQEMLSLNTGRMLADMGMILSCVSLCLGKSRSCADSVHDVRKPVCGSVTMMMGIVPIMQPPRAGLTDLLMI